MAQGLSTYKLDDELQHDVPISADTPFGEISAGDKSSFEAQVVASFESQLNACQGWRSQYFDDLWQKCRDAVYGIKPAAPGSPDEIRSNLRIRYMHKLLESQSAKIVPSLLDFDPPVTVYPNDENSFYRGLKGKAAQKQLKYSFTSRQNAYNLILRWVKQGEALGLSPMKMWWAYEEGSKSIRRPELDDEGKTIGLNKVVIDEKYIIKDWPMNNVIDTTKFWWNPDAIDPEIDLRYTFEEVWKPLSEIQNSPLYFNTDQLTEEENLRDDNKSDSRTEGQSNLVQSTGEKMVRLYERWDRNTLIVVCNGVLIRYRDNPFDDGIIPYYFHRATILDDQFVGMGVVEPSLDQEQLANTILNQRLDNVHRIINKMIFVGSGSGLKSKRLKFSPLAIKRVNNVDQVKPLEIGDVTQSAYIEQAKAEAAMDDMAGDPDITRGELPAGGRESATSVDIRAAGGSFRLNLKIYGAQIEYSRMYRDMYRLEKQFGDPMRWVMILGDDGREYNFQHDELFVDDYEFDYTLSGYLGNKAVEFQQYIQGLGVIKGIPGMIEQFDIQEMARQFIEKANIRGGDRLLKKPGMVEQGYNRDPYDENTRMTMFGDVFEVLPGEQHSKHIPVHMQAIDTPGIPIDVRERLLAHYNQHLLFYLEDARVQGSIGGQVGAAQQQLQEFLPNAVGQTQNQAAGFGGRTLGGANNVRQ